ncbi:MAG TPA: universal stress protein [Chryseolinea sp.]|nr:universal stress protein [Chryseolinea sp.]
MKTVIAPVDFSDASSNALSFAAELCKRASAQLIIVHVLAEVEAVKDAKSKLKNIESDLKKTFGSSLNCQSSVLRGDLVDALKETIAFQQPDLIVMGTKGVSGLKRILIGSNTVNVISHTKVPVLVIPEVARFEDFNRKGKNRIILATDLDSVDNEDSLELLKEIALLIIEPLVKVLSVRPENSNIDELTRMERNALISLFSPEIPSENATVFSHNVMSGINYYLSTHSDTRLIAMIARDSGQLIQKHYTREMASHTHLPLLVLHDAKD